MKVDRLVLRERVLKPGARLLADALKRRARDVDERANALELAFGRLEELDDRLDVPAMVDDLHVA